MRISIVISIYILTMALVTYLIRMTPFVLFRKKIKSAFIKSLLYYLPYAVLSAMVIPAVFSSTGNLITALAGLTAAIILSLCKRSLIVVALGSVVTVYVTGLILTLI